MNTKSLDDSALMNACCQHIFTLESKVSKEEFSIEEIGNDIPGSVMVQDLSIMANIYMNKRGCDKLQHSLEGLEALGPAYYQKFFPEEEMKVNMGVMLGMIERQDMTEVYRFFQRVRTNENAEYTWYFTTSKLFRPHADQTTYKIIHIANEVSSLGEIAKKVHHVLEENEFIKDNFNKFSLLTKREKEIIALLVQGKNSADISDIFRISRFTVNTHRRNIAAKLGVRTFAELLRFALAFDLD